MTPAARSLGIETPDGSMTSVLHLPDGEGPFPGLVLLMEAFGLNDHIRDLARRLAAEGYATLAPDLYFREEVRVVPYAERERVVDLMMRTIALGDDAAERVKDDRVADDIAHALRALRAQSEVDVERIGAIGFCMGGRLAFLAGCRQGAGLRAVVAFYGGRIVPLLPEADKIAAPLLLHFGAEDASIPLPQVERIRADLGVLGKACEIHVYPGAGHGFFCDERDSFHAPSAASAWTRSLRFMAEHLG